MKKAFITGISGQDGSYLAEVLLEKGYEVHGLIRPASQKKDRLWRIQSIHDRVTLHTGEMENATRLESILKTLQPDECYHLAAESFAGSQGEQDATLLQVNVGGTHHLLSALTSAVPGCRFFFAGSSEMFGTADVAPQTETTAFHPRSVYGESKVKGHNLICQFREDHRLFACTGFLYNHESPRRGMRFVTRKITATAAKIKLGMETELRLGNVEAERDWGFAGDYAQAMHACLNYTETPEDFIIATGRTHTVRELVALAFGELDLNYESHLVIDPEFFRPQETIPLVGDASKAKLQLGWQPRKSFEDLIKEMVRSDLDYFSDLL